MTKQYKYVEYEKLSDAVIADELAQDVFYYDEYSNEWYLRDGDHQYWDIEKKYAKRVEIKEKTVEAWGLLVDGILSNENLRVIHAAVKSKDGRIFFGKSHAECFGKAHYLKVKMSQKACDQGFLLSNGEYAERPLAAEIALKAGQLDGDVKILFSEDLWSPSHGGKFKYDTIEGYVLTGGDV